MGLTLLLDHVLVDLPNHGLEDFGRVARSRDIDFNPWLVIALNLDVDLRILGLWGG